MPTNLSFCECVCVRVSPIQVHDPVRVHTGTRGEWTLCCRLTWLEAYGKSPWEWKKAPLFQFLPSYFMAGFRAEHKEPNKQRAIHGQEQRWSCRIQPECVGREGWEGARSVQVCVNVFSKRTCMCVSAWCLGRWTSAPLGTGSPWLVQTRIADHINAAPHLSLSPSLPPFSLSPAICTLFTLYQTS